MRTLHCGRFPLTGASLLAMYRVRRDVYSPPPGIVQGGKRMLKDLSFVGWDPIRISISVWGGREVYLFPDSKLVKICEICKRISELRELGSNSGVL